MVGEGSRLSIGWQYICPLPFQKHLLKRFVSFTQGIPTAGNKETTRYFGMRERRTGRQKTRRIWTLTSRLFKIKGPCFAHA